MKHFANGIFYSKMNYGLAAAVFGNIFDLQKYAEANKRHDSFTRKDLNTIQAEVQKVRPLGHRWPGRYKNYMIW